MEAKLPHWDPMYCPGFISYRNMGIMINVIGTLVDVKLDDKEDILNRVPCYAEVDMPLISLPTIELIKVIQGMGFGER